MHIQNILYLLLLLIPLVPKRLHIITGFNRWFGLLIFILILIKTKKFYLDKGLNIFWIFFILLAVPIIYHQDFKFLLLRLTDIVIPAYCGYAFVKVEKRRYDFFNILIISAVMLSIFSIIEAFTGFNIFAWLFGYTIERGAANDYRLGIARAASSFDNSINYCVYLIMISFVCIYIAAFDGSKNEMKRKRIALCLILTAAFLTLSRGPLLVGCVVYLYLLMSTGLLKRSNLRKGILFILPIAILLCIIYFERIKIAIQVLIAIIGTSFNIEKYNKLASSYGFGSGDQRAGLFKWVASDLKGHWFLGRGHKYDFGVWINVNNTGYMVRKTSIENYYLAVALSNGLCGLASIVLTYLFLLIKFWLIKYRDLKKTDKMYHIIICLILFFAGACLTVSVDSELILFYMIIGYAIGINRIDRKAGEIA